MQILLTDVRSRWSLMAGAALLAGIVSYGAGKNWLAEYWAASGKPERGVKAAELEPDNAEHWYRLGRFRQLDLEHPDLPLAISYYERAVVIDRLSATYWLDLASTYEIAGMRDRAQEAFKTAVAAYPISSEVAWKYGNFLLRQESVPEAFAEIRRAVAVDPRLAGPAISRCWRASGDIHRALDAVLPAKTEVYLEALDFLVAGREMEAAVGAWQRLAELRPRLELRRALPLLDGLIEQERMEEARRVWQQALEFSGWPVFKPPDGSLVWDGGFEGDFINGGFGWRQSPIAGATFEFDTTTFHSGSRSLRVTFDGGANLDFAHLTQHVPVEPHTRYRFSAYLRTEKISTNSGVRFVIFDVHRPEQQSGSTSNLVDTHSWTREEFEFTTGPQARVLEIVLRRYPSQKLDNKIRGTVWADDVSLVVVRQPVAGSAP